MKNAIAAVGILSLMLISAQFVLAEGDCGSKVESRIYSGYVARWLGVDPLADKYPDVSPYVYCEDNPLMYVDPDGRYVKDSTNFDALYKYADNLLNDPTIENFDRKEQLRQTQADIQAMYSDPNVEYSLTQEDNLQEPETTISLNKLGQIRISMKVNEIESASGCHEVSHGGDFAFKRLTILRPFQHSKSFLKYMPELVILVGSMAESELGAYRAELGASGMLIINTINKNNSVFTFKNLTIDAISTFIQTDGSTVYPSSSGLSYFEWRHGVATIWLRY